MLGADGAGVGFDVLHADRIEFKTLRVPVGIRSVPGNQVAHVPAVT